MRQPERSFVFYAMAYILIALTCGLVQTGCKEVDPIDPLETLSEVISQPEQPPEQPDSEPTSPDQPADPEQTSDTQNQNSTSTQQEPIELEVSAVASDAANPLSVRFTAEVLRGTIESPDSIEWTFGDGQTATGTEVVHTYQAEGNYRVSVTAHPADSGPLYTTDLLISVYPFTASIVAKPAEDGPTRKFQLSAQVTVPCGHSIASYVWSIDGKELSLHEGEIEYTFPEDGTHEISLSVTTDKGWQQVATTYIQITPDNSPPVAKITAQPSSGTAPLTVTFSAAGSYDPDGSIQNCSWDFGDGTSTAGTEVTHTYDSPGNYIVVLTVTDDRGSTSQDTVTVHVNAGPTAAFKVIPDGNVAPTTVTFDAGASSDSDGRIIMYRWDFGDGQTAEGYGMSRVRHAYEHGGVYDVTLTVTDDEGATATIKKSVWLAELSIEPQTLDLGDSGTTAAFRITNIGSDWLSYSIQIAYNGTEQGWLTCDRTEGTCNPGESAEIAVNANRSRLAPGLHTAEISVTAGSVTRKVSVCIAVVAVSLSIDHHDFGEDADSVQVEIWNSGAGVLQYSVTQKPEWLTVDGVPGTSSGPSDRKVLTLTVNRNGLAPGSYSGTLTISPAPQQQGKAASITVEMNVPPPPLTADAGPDKSIIRGESTTLEGSANGGVPPYTYSWSPADGLSATDVATPDASPTQTATYTLTVTDSIGQTASDTVTVSVADPPKVLVGLEITGPESVPAGSTGTYTATATYDDGSTEDVTAEANWSVAGQAGSFSSPGIFQAPAGIDTLVSVTIQAEFNKDGVSKQARKIITLTPNTGETNWTPPIGIPEPEFGITQTHWMYQGQLYDYGNGPEPYRDAGNGPYTHYIDNTHPNATDSNNPFGTPDRPRKTIPNTWLPPGSIVEVHGGPYNYSIGGRIPIYSAGTAEKPVFVRGVSTDDMPVFTRKVSVYGTYLILENIQGMAVQIAATTSYGPVHHIAVRHCEIRDADRTAVQILGRTDDEQATVSDVVFFDNKVHDIGDIYADYDQDYCCICINARVSRVWIVDNELYRASGGAVQVNARSIDYQSTTHHIYAGRNVVWQTRQAGLFVKQAVDVVFSQNVVHDIITTSWSKSKGLGFQYAPDRVWFIYNRIYNCEFGIYAGSDSGMGFGKDQYVIGNIISNIHYGDAYNPRTAWSAAGIMLAGGTNRYIINNTIYDADAGINGPGGGAYHIVNNIVVNVTRGNHIFVEVGTTASNSTMRNNLLYQKDGPIKIRWGSGTIYNTIDAFQAVTGKGENCIVADPLFQDPDNGDFRLLPGSPAIDAGTPHQVYELFRQLYGLEIHKDLTGQSRPQGAQWDIGAIEYSTP